MRVDFFDGERCAVLRALASVDGTENARAQSILVVFREYILVYSQRLFDVGRRHIRLGHAQTGVKDPPLKALEKERRLVRSWASSASD